MNTRCNTLFACGIVAMALMLTATSCRDDGPVPTIHLNENFKEFIYFKEGTEWTYMNTEDSTIVSSIVIENSISINEGRPEEDELPLFMAESFLYKVNSQRIGKIVEYQGVSSGCIDFDERELVEHGSPCFFESRKASNAAFRIFFYYPHIGHKAAPIGHSKITLAEYFDSIYVGGQYYQEIYRIHETKNPLEGKKETNFYVARGYGIIRKELNDKERDMDPDNWQQWDLIESTIIQ
jgi:hypothetical protein